MSVVNRRAYHDYEILSEVEAGVALFGWEVKSLKAGRASLEGAFVKPLGTELVLLNAQIFPYQFTRADIQDPRRARKLLLHKREIEALNAKMSGSKLTLVPLSLYLKKRLFKLKIGLAKGKKEYEKREKIKRRDIERDTERNLRAKVR